MQSGLRRNILANTAIAVTQLRRDFQFDHATFTDQLHALCPAPKGELALREQLCLAANDGLRATLEAEGSFAMIYERYSLWSFAGMEYARAMGTPGLLEVNAPLIEEQAEHRRRDGGVDRGDAHTRDREDFTWTVDLVEQREIRDQTRPSRGHRAVEKRPRQ